MLLCLRFTSYMDRFPSIYYKAKLKNELTPSRKKTVF